ncbi:MAG: transglycosylase domain-containing protein [Eubacterium sp.]|nr:transglycosylase domain-containing protein [Eubacterium sp.]
MIFNKYSVKKRRKQLMSKEQRYIRRVMVSGFKIILSAFIICIILLAGAGFGVMKGILDDAPDPRSINIKPKGFKTIIVDQQGNEIDSLSMINSNRIYVYYEDIPKQFVNAFVAIEDERFWDHNGIDVRGIFRALVRDLASGSMDEGASTITQQLIKNQAFNGGDEPTKIQRIERKVQEQMLAMELEKIYTKEQIIEYYLNTIYLGQGVNGIEAASQRYFDKSIGELNVSEIAMIAGITQNPYGFDPVIFPENNAKRRIDVLNKMKELGYITEEEYKAAHDDDVYARVKEVKQQEEENFEYNSYFKDALMWAFVEDLEEMYGYTEAEAFNEMYTGGYTIYSTQDFGIQRVCDNVVNDPEYYPEETEVVINYDLVIMDGDGKTPHYYDQNSLVSYFMRTTEDYSYKNLYPDEASARQAADEFKEAMLDETDGSFVSEDMKFAIQPQASVSVIDQHTGYVKAVTGGRGKKTENLGFNRATDAKRQPGSCFKVVAAFLPYIDTMGGLCNMYEDKPYEYLDGSPVKNWYEGYKGWSSIRMGIQESMNIVAVQAITDVTPEVAFEYLKRLGFTTLVDEYIAPDGKPYTDINQSLALGGLTYGVTNLEITAAYAAIANMGTYIKPCFYSQVYDHDGNLIIDNTVPEKLPTTHAVCKETTAWQLLDAMKDVITQGTGMKAQLNTGGVAAGKTGTTSNCYDLWFCGMTPYYTASVWYGIDTPSYADTQLHKYMWRDIMDGIAELEGHDPSLDWDMPDGLTQVTVCRLSGLLPVAGCPTSTDYCAEENVPCDRCKGGHETSIKICDETHKKATNACPCVTEYQVKQEGDKRIIVDCPFKYDDSIWESECDKHKPVEGDFVIVNRVFDGGGTIDATMGVAGGSTVTVHWSPADGYEVETVWVDGEPQFGASEYTFTDISDSHSITVKFKKKEGAPGQPDPNQPQPDPNQPQPDPGQPQPDPNQPQPDPNQPNSEQPESQPEPEQINPESQP